MSWSWTLYRYLALQFLAGFAMMYSGFLALAFAIDVVALLNRPTVQAIDTMTVVGMAVLQLPDLGQKMLPFAVLGGGVFSFLKLARSQELVATRAAGVSAWDFLLPALSVAVLIGILTVTVFTPIASRMFAEVGALEARYIKGKPALALSDNGVWLRQGDEKEQSVVHAVTATEQGERLENVLVFLYHGESFAGRIEAKSAQLGDHVWQLEDAWVSTGGNTPQHHDTYQLATTLPPAQILESFVPPDALSFWELPSYIRSAQAAGFSALRYRVYFFSLCVLPALYAAMVFMAASFSLRPAREGGLAKAILLSVAGGFGVYFFQQLFFV